MQAISTATKEHKNWLIYLLYSKQEFAECLKLIETCITTFGHDCDYAVYIKGLIERQQGDIPNSLSRFQQILEGNPKYAPAQKQV
jgi:Bardet-Biedl syndrome 4 protein